MTITNNFGFINDEPLCMTLQYGEKIYDTYCYDPHEEEDNIAVGQQVDYRHVDIKITDVVYDPTRQ